MSKNWFTIYLVVILCYIPCCANAAENKCLGKFMAQLTTHEVPSGAGTRFFIVKRGPEQLLNIYVIEQQTGQAAQLVLGWDHLAFCCSKADLNDSHFVKSLAHLISETSGDPVLSQNVEAVLEAAKAIVARIQTQIH